MESKQIIMQKKYNNRSYASDYQFINSRVLSANTITNPPLWILNILSCKNTIKDIMPLTISLSIQECYQLIQ